MYGNNLEVQILFQNSFGSTAAGAGGGYFPLIEESITLDIADLVSANMRGVFDEGPSYNGLQNIGGDLVSDVNIRTTGVFCRMLCGSATAVTSGSLKTYTWKPAQSDFDDYCANPPLYIIKDMKAGATITSEAFHAYNMCASKLQFEVANGEFLKSTISLVGGRFFFGTEVAASYSTDSLYTWDQASVSIGGTAITNLKSLSITIDDKVEAVFTMNNNKYPSRMKRNGSRTIDVNGSLIFTNNSEWLEFQNSTERQFIAFFKSGVEVQSGYPESIKFDIPSFRYTAYPVNVSGPNEVEVSFSGKAKYNSGSATAIAITLTTTAATI